MHKHLDEPTERTREVFVSRQAIYTSQLEVMAYTLCFDSSRGRDYQATAQGLLTSVLETGLQALVGKKLAFLPITRGFMLLGYTNVFPPDQVTLALPATLTVDEEVLEVVRDMSAHGYALALAHDLVHDSLPALVEHATFLTFDVSSMDRPTLQHRVAGLRQYALPLVAQHVQSQDDFQYCHDLGFAYFHGAFICQPAVLKSQRLPTNHLALLHLLAKLQDPLVTVDTLAQLISQDVALSYRILRAINVAAYGLSRPIASIRQAVQLLGVTAITIWTSLMILTEVRDKPPELMALAMVRAKMCERLARTLGQDSTASCFLVGLFSVLDALLDRPMPDILQTLPLVEDVHRALLDHAGILGIILHSVLAYEQGNWAEAADLGLDDSIMIDAYLDAIAWAAKTRDTLGWI